MNRETVRGLPGTNPDYHPHGMFDRANYAAFRKGEAGVTRQINAGERFYAYTVWAWLPVGLGIVMLACNHQQKRAGKW